MEAPPSPPSPVALPQGEGPESAKQGGTDTLGGLLSTLGHLLARLGLLQSLNYKLLVLPLTLRTAKVVSMLGPVRGWRKCIGDKLSVAAAVLRPPEIGGVFCPHPGEAMADF